MGCGASHIEQVQEFPEASHESSSATSAFLSISIGATPRGARRGGDDGKQVTTPRVKTTRDLSAAELASTRKEWEAVSAPMATMSLQKLQKFHARLLRKDGGRVLMNMRANNVIGSLRKKPIEKEIRDQAKKTSVWLFKKLNYWDIDTDEPIEDKTVSLEEYLELVCRVTVKTTDIMASAGTNAANSILKHHHTSCCISTAPQGCSVTPQIAVESAGDITAQKLRPRRLRFPDSPSTEQLQREWEAQMASFCEMLKRHSQHDADEGAAFKQRKAVEMDGGLDALNQNSYQHGFGLASSSSATSGAAADADAAGSPAPAFASVGNVLHSEASDVPVLTWVKTEVEEATVEKNKWTADDENKKRASGEEIDIREVSTASKKLSGLVVERVYSPLDGEVEDKLKVMKEVKESVMRHKESLARREE